MAWDPTQYLQFANERLRPFVELINRIHVESPRRVVDLGCGPGTATVLLAQRWSDAQVLGVDTSKEMVERASQLVQPGRLTFVLGDAREFASEHDVDVLVSNAALQWIPKHLEHFSMWIDSLSSDGWFAFQVPAMKDQPSHRLIYELASRKRYEGRLDPLIAEQSIEAPERYLEVLTDLGCDVDLWETTYFQLLGGDDAIYEWTKSTSLRPFLNALNGAELEEFVDRYRTEARALYPRGPAGTVFPFRRIFVVAHLR